MEGYDDCKQLTSHEKTKHYFHCGLCDEAFMVKSDLDVHVSTKHKVTPSGQCEECICICVCKRKSIT